MYGQSILLWVSLILTKLDELRDSLDLSWLKQKSLQARLKVLRTFPVSQVL